MEQQKIWNKRYIGNLKSPANDQWLETFMGYIRKKQNGTIVDLGCGRGFNALYLAEQGYNVIACDFSCAALEFIRKTNPLIETRCFDMIHAFPNDIKNADVVLASLSTHYFTLENTIKLYNNIRMILKPEGYFIFRVNGKMELEKKDKPNVNRMIEQDYYMLHDGVTKRYFDVDSLSALLKDFSVLAINERSARYNGKIKYYVEGVAQKV